MKPMHSGSLSPELILRLQRTAGNRAVQRLIERSRAASLVISDAQPASFEVLAKTEQPEPSWWRRRLGWIAGPGTLALSLGLFHWLTLHVFCSVCVAG
jgi:hypothetical protein